MPSAPQNTPNRRTAIDVAMHDFIVNDVGEWTLALDGQKEPPGEAHLVLSTKRPEAVLHRGNGQPMHIAHIHPEAYEQLKQANDVLVTELDGEEILHSYVAPIRATS